MTTTNPIQFISYLLLIIFKGWLYLLGVFIHKILSFFQTKTFPEKIFFISLLIQVATSALGWIQYQIEFNNEIELVAISIRWNVFFVTGSLLNFFFTGFWRSSWVWLFFLVCQTFMLLLFGYASLNPEMAFTDILKSSDYRLSIVYYIFGASLVMAWAIGFSIFQLESFKSKRLPKL
jgi:hypothetical protein